MGRRSQYPVRLSDSAGDSPERTRAAAEELVALAPDLIFVSTNPALSATMEATRIIPIVFTWVSDSVGSGYVASLGPSGRERDRLHNFESRHSAANGWRCSRRSRQACVGSQSSTCRKYPPISRSSAQLKRHQGAGNNGHPRCRAQCRRC